MNIHFTNERNVFASLKRFATIPPSVTKEAELFYTNLEATSGRTKGSEKVKTPGIVYKRNDLIKGPLSVFGSDYFEDHYGEEKAQTIRLLKYSGLWGQYYAYEALNFVDGVRSTTDIRNALSAEFGPIPLEVVEEYLKALESIDVILPAAIRPQVIKTR